MTRIQNQEIKIESLKNKLFTKEGLRLRHIIKIITQEDVLTTNQQQGVVDARKIFITILIEDSFSVADIGRFLNKNHSTVLNQRDKCLDLFKTQKSFAKSYRDVLVMYQGEMPRELQIPDKYVRESIESLEKKVKELSLQVESLTKQALEWH